ncbi:MAG: lipid biosynthesis B12-binding/radical SAM protein, partial [Candidatus Omnitrophica bacterium]|nr:lipid biosynthesis B12-binding/radical SAM protein [Candidatus Omnitrophota bacterium]
MKILLISANTAATPYPVYPLGMSVVAGALARAGHEVRQIDFLREGRSPESLKKTAAEFKPDFIGISVRNIDNVNCANEQRYIDVVRDIVGVFKSSADAVPVVLGGTGFSVMPEEILAATGADYGIAGEGEESVVEFARGLASGKLPAERIFRARNKLPGMSIEPALYDPRIMKFYQASGNMANVQTKRGCVYKCVYCTYPGLEGELIRARSASAVVDDIRRLIEEHGIRYLFFTDSVFNDDEGHYIRVLEEMRRRRVSVPWTAFFKPDGLKEETVALMKEIGLKAAEIGADAATDTTLKGLGKPFRFADIAAANDIFVRNGVATAQYYMFGGPAETEDTVLEGIRNILSLSKTVSFVFMGIRILPGTALEKIAISEGLLKAGAPLLEPVYYISPVIGRIWLERILRESFDTARSVVFPPDKYESTLQFLHKLGYAGSLWEMLLDEKKSFRRSRARN